MDDIEEVARRAAAGDKGALDDVLRLARPIVSRMAARMLENPLDAEEAVQDALFAVSRHIGRFEGRSKFTTWLYPIVLNTSRDTYRRLKRRASVLGIDVHDRPADARVSVIAGGRVDLLEALEQMDPAFGEPVVLRDMYQLSYSEIAEQMGIAEGTVKSRIHEGRKTLQYLLSRQ